MQLEAQDTAEPFVRVSISKWEDVAFYNPILANWKR